MQEGQLDQIGSLSLYMLLSPTLSPVIIPLCCNSSSNSCCTRYQMTNFLWFNSAGCDTLVCSKIHNYGELWQYHGMGGVLLFRLNKSTFSTSQKGYEDEVKPDSSPILFPFIKGNDSCVYATPPTLSEEVVETYEINSIIHI